MNAVQQINALLSCIYNSIQRVYTSIITNKGDEYLFGSIQIVFASFIEVERVSDIWCTHCLRLRRYASINSIRCFFFLLFCCCCSLLLSFSFSSITWNGHTQRRYICCVYAWHSAFHSRAHVCYLCAFQRIQHNSFAGVVFLFALTLSGDGVLSSSSTLELGRDDKRQRLQQQQAATALATIFKTSADYNNNNNNSIKYKKQPWKSTEPISLSTWAIEYGDNER